MLCKMVLENSLDDSLFVFFSGFGADYKYWDTLLPYFSKRNYVLLSENYFKDSGDCKFEDFQDILKNKRLIGIGHSLGYQKLCNLTKEFDFFNLRKIVSLEGFSSYLGRSEPMRSIRKFYLDLMRCSYTFCPKITLKNFMIMCGAQVGTLPPYLDEKLLMDDLSLLYTDVSSPKIPHLILTSIDDWVIPSVIIEDNFRQLQDKEIIYTYGASHLLGMRFPKYVSEEIQKFADR